jgi:hypothetical protein
VIVKRIRGSQKSGLRPYVQYQHARYRNPELANSFDLVGSKVVIHVRSADVSTIDAFLPSGEPLGNLMAEGRWGEVSHSEEVRKEIGQLINAAGYHLGPETDPVQELLQRYANEASQDAKKKPKKVSKAATKLAKVAHETGRDIPEPEPPSSAAVKPPPSPSSMRFVKSPNWKTI